MRVWITSNEWYPVYYLGSAGDYETGDVDGVAEVPPDKVSEWRRVFREFDRVQDELRAAAESSQK